MPLGPVQLLVVGFDRPDFALVVVHKDAEGVVRRLHRGAEAEEAGAVVAALIGLDVEIGDEPAAEEELWSLDEAIPDDSAAAIALLEHRWAIGTREAILAAGGAPIADAWVHPADLVAAGLAGAEDAAAPGG